MKIILHLIISALAIIVTALLVPGLAQVTIVGAILAAVVIGILNLLLKPILLILTLPINIITLGLFSLVINAIIVYFAAMITPDFVINGFGAAFVFALILSLVNLFFHVVSKA